MFVPAGKGRVTNSLDQNSTQTMKQYMYRCRCRLIGQRKEMERGRGREGKRERERERERERTNSLTHNNHLQLVPNCKYTLSQHAGDAATGAGGGQDVTWRGKLYCLLRDWLPRLIKPPERVCVCMCVRIVAGGRVLWISVCSR